MTRPRLLLVLLLLSLGCSGWLPAAPTHEVVATFQAPPGGPTGRPLEYDGFLYGTTAPNAAYPGGTIYRVRLDGTGSSVVHVFGTGNVPGEPLLPNGRLLRNAAGSLFGTTKSGGADGFGTVFEYTPSGQLLTRVSFTGTGGAFRGTEPGNLVLKSDGSICGTTFKGGVADVGTIFRISPQGVFETIFEFTPAAGTNPHGLREAPDGSLLGATSLRAFRLQGSTFTILANAPGSAKPGVPVQAADGTVYGTFGQYAGASQYGQIWQVSPSGVFSTLTDFTTYYTGDPVGELHLGSDGALYGLGHGSSQTNGDRVDPGTDTLPPYVSVNTGSLWRLRPGQAVEHLVTVGSCGDDQCSNPQLYRNVIDGLTVGSDGAIYWVATAGGNGGGGAIFRYPQIAPNVSNVLFPFGEAGAALLGSEPVGGLMQAASGSIYGTTSKGGVRQSGTYFRLDEAGEVQTLRDTGLQGPVSALVEVSDGYFYGTSPGSGVRVYRLSPDGVQLDQVVAATSTAQSPASKPLASLVLGGDGQLYGTASEGFATQFSLGGGAVFRVSTAGAFVTLKSLTGSGITPSAELLRGVDGQFYGTTRYGNGTVFRIDAAGNFATVASLPGSNSPYLDDGPLGGVVPGPGGSLLGTRAGGISTAGSLFRVEADGSVTTLVDFAAVGLARPRATLTQGLDGNYYGTTAAGGNGGQGAVFRLTAAGEFAVLVHFASPGQPDNGRAPGTGALVMARDGNLYGTTQFGGARGGGTVFRVRFGPTPQTLAASGLGPVSATLAGLLNPNGAVSAAYFEYGTSPTVLDRQTALQSFPSGTAALPVEATLSGLQPETRYYYRLRGENAEQMLPQRGAVLSFVTGPALAAQVQSATAPGAPVTVTLTGLPGGYCQLYGTTSLDQPWTPLSSVLPLGPNGRFQFTDQTPPAQRFYRAVLLD